MKPLISITVAALALGTASTVQADQVCMVADEMKAALIDWYGERPIAAPSEMNEQIWVSEATGTWTMVKLLADGTACVLAQGDGWMTDGTNDQIIARLGD